ncbi:HIT family protein [Haloplanus pelagicus]|jgi:ATP adenylyltransferase|uniref:HIT family protein n=1 Tax=Haloplanus pelagicus TaxID=2949995 RepID=UPI0020407CB2|nr:HIT domain-containing protein [Haloplanus sp. HW8-1]
MERLFAPWRIDWVTRDEDDTLDGCPFCVLPDGDDDRANRIVARSDHAFVVLNNAPYNPGHAMVIPYRHDGEYRALDAPELLDHARLKQRTIEAIEAALDSDAHNVGLNLGGGPAGGSIDDHLHTHVIPRWEGDTNFMPVVADTKVIVEAIDDTYDHLHEAFAAQADATVPSPDRAVSLSLSPD